MVGFGRREEERGNPQRLGEVLRGYLGTEGMRPGMALGRLTRSWETVVGDRLAPETSPRALDRGRLVVSASTAAWAAHAAFLKGDICRRANEVLGSKEVASVVVVVGRSRMKPP
jgi:predicted nucleic acid-binding Zn ribbon protein